MMNTQGDNPLIRPARVCWCGNDALAAFSDGYVRCGRCGTLVSTYRHTGDVSRVGDDEAGLYGREYWHSPKKADLGSGTIYARAQTDLVDRCPYWLRAVLRLSGPPARVLELGSSHGGFVAVLRLAGFDATGLELSPAVVATARDLFDVPMLQGPIEDQHLEPGSLDLVVAMDVLEHLPDPVQTMTRCLELLRPGGALLIQTPMYPDPASLANLEHAGHRFVEMLRAQEHLYLFSAASVRRLFDGLGCSHVQFEPARFSHYDMFVAVSRAPIVARSVEAQAAGLQRSAGGRLALAMLELFERAEYGEAQVARAALEADVAHLKAQLTSSEADRAARLAVIDQQGAELGRLPALQADIDFLKAQLVASEADRAARLVVIQERGAAIADSDVLREQVTSLTERLVACEEDRAARLDVIQRQGAELGRIGTLEDVIVQLKRQLGIRPPSRGATGRDDD